jgi:replication factor C subunit 2/4
MSSFCSGRKGSIDCFVIFVLQAQQLLLEFQAGLLKDQSLKDPQRARICTVLAEADKCLVDGADEFLQLLHVASVAQQAICAA